MTGSRTTGTPWSLGVRCDRTGCPVRFEGDFLVSEVALLGERLEVALYHVRDKEGWQVIWPAGTGADEAETYCPAHKTTCPECQDTGMIWPEPERCTCGTGPSGYYGMHERHCGAEPCPAGCPVPTTPTAATAPESPRPTLP